MQAQVIVHNIIQGDIAQLDKLFQAAAAPLPAAALRSTTAEQFCALLLQQNQFDPALTAQLSILQKTLAFKITLDDSFYSNSQQVLRQSLNIIIARSSTWYARDSKSSQQFFDKLVNFIDVCCNNSPEKLLNAQHEFKRWLDIEDKRAAMLETRLCETEINHFKMQSTEVRVIDLINGALGFKAFAQEGIAGITSVLKNELLHSYFTSGDDNPFWKKWQQLLPILGKIFKTISTENLSESDEQTLYRTIPALLNELELSLNINTSNSNNYKQWVETLCEQLMLAIRKQPIQCEAFIALSYPDDYNHLNTRVTTEVLQQTDNLSEGDWILFNGENETIIRCKLALKNIEIDQLLFVDHTGRKVMNKSIKDFAVCLSTGIATKMILPNPEMAITQTLQTLIDNYQQRRIQQQTQTKEKLASELVNIELQREAEAKHKAEIAAESKRKIVQQLSERQAAAQKALAEAGVLAKERAERAANLQREQDRTRIQLEAEQAAENLQRIQLANINVSALNLGARVELIINNEPVRCKLAVIIAATGKYIFVDNLGRKVTELQREQLVQALINNQLTLVNNGDSFDDQLVKVIRGLRKDIS